MFEALTSSNLKSLSLDSVIVTRKGTSSSGIIMTTCIDHKDLHSATGTYVSGLILLILSATILEDSRRHCANIVARLIDRICIILV